jgi:hypothetical protein
MMFMHNTQEFSLKLYTLFLRETLARVLAHQEDLPWC